MKQNTWILIANSSTAKLYESGRVGHEQQLVADFEHPESREKNLDLISDRMGHYEARGSDGSGSYQEPISAKENEHVLFAKELAQELEAGRLKQKYDRLIIASSPHFLGLLKQQCSGHVTDLIWHSIEKDYTQLDDKTLLEHLKQLVKPF